MAEFSLDDFCRGFNWLGHEGVTELAALHPEYRPGRENFEWNKKHDALPRVGHAWSAEEALMFTRRNYPGRMVCYSLNDRPRMFTNDRGYPRAAREEEIELSRNLFVDLDFEDKKVSEAHRAEFKDAGLKEIDGYFQDLGFRVPEKGDSGRGWHLLSAYAPIYVKDVPDTKERLKKFGRELATDLRHVLQKYEVRSDSVFDLRRMVKCYGTAKPDVGIVSKFYGGERHEDNAVRAYLLGMVLVEHVHGQAARDGYAPVFGAPMVRLGNELPPLFLSLLNRDEKLKQLWSGNGKAHGADHSHTGYDFSITRRLLFLGYRNLDDIATVLAVRPEGAVRKSGKGEQYVRRTIANALAS